MTVEDFDWRCLVEWYSTSIMPVLINESESLLVAVPVVVQHIGVQTGILQGVRDAEDVTDAAGCVITSRDSALAQYWYRCQRFWLQVDRRIDPGRWVAIRRNITTQQQGTRSDLISSYEALRTVPIVGRIIEELLNHPQEETVLQTLAGDMPLQLLGEEDGAQTWRMICAKESWPVWADILGGGYGPGETAREIEITVRYAKWRDRRVRRLVRVSTFAHEVWPA